MAFVNVISNETFVDCLNDMVKHFDVVHNCFSEFTYFEYYATAYINAIFNMHRVSIRDFELFRIRLIDMLISSHCYFDFRDSVVELIYDIDSSLLPFV